MKKPNIVKIDLKEKSRTYIFPGKQELTIEEPKVCYVNEETGVHRLMNAKEEIYFVPRGWLGLKIIDK